MTAAPSDIAAVSSARELWRREAANAARADDRFQLELGELLRTETDSQALLFAVAEKLAGHLGVPRAYFTEVLEREDRIVVHRDFHGHLPSLAGSRPLSTLGEAFLAFRRSGQTDVCSDVTQNPRFAQAYESQLKALQIRALLTVPLLRDGVWVSNLTCATPEPRAWNDREVALIQLTAERTWLWIDSLRAAEALRRNERRTAAILRSALDGIAAFDHAGRIVEFNPAAEAIFGLRLDEAIGKSLADLLVLPPVRDGADPDLGARLRDGASPLVGRTLELPAVRSDGVELTVEVAITRVEGEEPPVFTAVIRDVSERKRNERERAQERAAAERARERGRSFDLSVDMVCVADTNGRFLQLNPAFSKTLGYSKEELLTTPLLHLIHPDDQAATRWQLSRLAYGAGSVEISNRCRGKDGSYRWLEWRAISESDGTFYGVARDQTIEREFAEALRLSEERQRLLIEGARDYALFMLDPQGRVATWNSGAERLKGYTAAEILGKHFSIFYPKEVQEAGHPAEELELAKRGGRYEEEGWRVRKDGSRFWGNVTITALLGEEGQLIGFVKLMRDFTERRRAEEILEGQRVSLAASLKEREVLLQEVHHRVKNNLQVISSLINLQMRQLKDPAARSALEECQSRVAAIALIHEKLYQSKDYAKIPFSDYARSLAANVFHATGVSASSVALEIDIEALALPVDRAIPCGLILNELITNALKHAFPNERVGQVRVEMRNENGKDLLLVVSDDGVGMAATVNPQKSRSLGMTLITTLVDQLDGKLEVVRGNGTSFRIAFPLEAA